jgi:hypothetical protein
MSHPREQIALVTPCRLPSAASRQSSKPTRTWEGGSNPPAPACLPDVMGVVISC